MKTAFCVLLAVLLLPGCRNKTTPTDVGPQSYYALDVFVGSLSPQGSQLRGVDVLQAAQIKITLVGLTLSGTSTTVSLPLTLRLGTSSADGATCSGSTTTDATPALTTHLTQQLAIGGYCVSVSDAGSLTGGVDFAVRIEQTANVDPFGQAGTETFSSNLYPAGALHRTFATGERGDIRATLTSVTPAAGVGFGLGVSSDGANCYLHKTLVTTAGSTAELSATADPGPYCVKIFDPGGLADRVVFNVEIRHQ